MTRKKTELDIELIALWTRFNYLWHDKGPEYEQEAKKALRELWEKATELKGPISDMAPSFVDRCSEGGFAVHSYSRGVSTLDSFIKKAPSKEWAEQAYRYSLRYGNNLKFKMGSSHQPFLYNDGTVLSVTEFIPGLDLDHFFLEASRPSRKKKFINHATDIGIVCLDDLVFLQDDAQKGDLMLTPKSSPDNVRDDIAAKIISSALNTREHGSVDISDEEISLLEDEALNAYNLLNLNEATIVPIADYCPKNQGIMLEGSNDWKEIAESISNKGKPDTKLIGKRLYHWDPTPRWGHFMEDFLAFYASYEFKRFNNIKGKDTLGNWFRAFLDVKKSHSPDFKEWVRSLNIGMWGRVDNFLRQDMYLALFFRATRKADLSSTLYAWRNEVLFKRRPFYESTKELLPIQTSFYNNLAKGAMIKILESYGKGAISMLSQYRRARSAGKDMAKYFKDAFRGAEDQEKDVLNCLYLLNIANKLSDRKINYGTLRRLEYPYELSASRISR
ncbi:MAG: hypothetical protein U9O94_03120 [Nanoarchaeota archaeon]|nr:hypothetical protein [Nanoarchaeota archaeon]